MGLGFGAGVWGWGLGLRAYGFLRTLLFYAGSTGFRRV